jgi:hypothetical protein
MTTPTFNRRATLLTFAALLGGMTAVALPAAEAQAAAVISLQVGPPPPRVERVPAPRRGYIWVSGYHVWQRGGYVWRPGYWVKDRPGYDYVSPGWVQDGPRWVYRPARWDRHAPPPPAARPPAHRPPPPPPPRDRR